MFNCYRYNNSGGGGRGWVLDEQLHFAIMKRVVCIQRYVKTKVERKNFIMLRESVQLLQV